MSITEILKTYISDVIPAGFLIAGGLELVIALALTVVTNERRYKSGKRYLLKRARNTLFIVLSIIGIIAGCYFGNNSFKHVTDTAIRYIATSMQEGTPSQTAGNAENTAIDIAEPANNGEKTPGSISGYAQD